VSDLHDYASELLQPGGPDPDRDDKPDIWGGILKQAMRAALDASLDESDTKH
jgi:hypothetical protein